MTNRSTAHSSTCQRKVRSCPQVSTSVICDFDILTQVSNDFALGSDFSSLRVCAFGNRIALYWFV